MTGAAGTVVHLITGLGSGGAERMLARIATRKDPGAPRQVVISLQDEGVHGPALRAAGVTLHCLGMRRGVPSPRLFLRLIALLRQEAPDVVMSWLYHADLLAALAAPLAGNPPVIWNLRCSDMDLSRYARSTRLVLSLLVRLSGRPWAIAYNSHAGHRVHAALGYRPGRWAYLPNGFDTSEWRPDEDDRAAVRASLDVGDREVLIGAVGRVDPQKDHETFMTAAALLAAREPNVRFVVIGRGTTGLVPPDQLSGRVAILGERDDVPRLMRGLDILALSSAFGEGFPNVVGEAMASGVPCVVTDVGDSADLVGCCGRSVPPRDPQALAAALADLAAAPPTERARLGAKARKKAEESWSLDAVASAYRALWAQAAAETRR